MSINVLQLAPMIAAGTTVGGLIFQIGKHAEKLDLIGYKVEAQEKKVEHTNTDLNEIKSSIQALQMDISYIKDEVHDIKQKVSR